jgi:hypothetical protein
MPSGSRTRAASTTSNTYRNSGNLSGWFGGAITSKLFGSGKDSSASSTWYGRKNKCGGTMPAQESVIEQSLLAQSPDLSNSSASTDPIDSRPPRAARPRLRSDSSVAGRQHQIAQAITEMELHKVRAESQSRAVKHDEKSKQQELARLPPESLLECSSDSETH